MTMEISAQIRAAEDFLTWRDGAGTTGDLQADLEEWSRHLEVEALREERDELRDRLGAVRLVLDGAAAEPGVSIITQLRQAAGLEPAVGEVPDASAA
ncbi:hypothetical protein BKA24_001784 [Microbacterium marinum]|uniref:Uncharacterized protein n=1 Tax=Microbacterium marinum TaxID=421115 RepID=A0A7W7BQN9_9MICO|nr:hypothetical protein [Microbacterium marinum]MBB4667075.1 hypothetical protein [Microbacterium marinum]